MSKILLLLGVINGVLALGMNIRHWVNPEPEPKKRRTVRIVLTVVFWVLVLTGAAFFFLAAMDDLLALL